MRNTIVRCGQCSGVLDIPGGTGAGTIGCRSCGAPTRLWLFPALYRAREGAQALALQEEGHSSCMNHPQKRAVAVCDGCGKYLCALCDVDWNGEHLCPSCIGHRKSEDTEGALRTTYVHYDLIALMLALLSIPTSFFGAFIAPVALFLCWRYWKTPWRPMPHRKWTMVIAAVVASMSFVGWVSLLVFALTSL